MCIILTLIYNRIHYENLPWLSGLLTTAPPLSKPKISFPTLLVLPDSASCLWRKSFCLACPLPLSSSLWVKTPSNVDFPASTFPTTATLNKQGNRYWKIIGHKFWSLHSIAILGLNFKQSWFVIYVQQKIVDVDHVINF